MRGSLLGEPLGLAPRLHLLAPPGHPLLQLFQGLAQIAHLVLETS